MPNEFPLLPGFLLSYHNHYDKYSLEISLKLGYSNNMDNKPAKGAYLETLLRSTQTVFSTKDVALLWGEQRAETITSRLNSYAASGKLLRVRRGFYVKDKNYNQLELATRIYTPSYISFETVLTREGINFQYYGNIFVASYVNREIQVGDQGISFVRMKEYVLRDTTGVVHTDGYGVATKERAFLDRLYVSKDYHFDNLDSLDWAKVTAMLPIYHSKRLTQRVNEYQQGHRKDNIQ